MQNENTFITHLLGYFMPLYLIDISETYVHEIYPLSRN